MDLSQRARVPMDLNKSGYLGNDITLGKQKMIPVGEIACYYDNDYETCFLVRCEAVLMVPICTVSYPQNSKHNSARLFIDSPKVKRLRTNFL